MFKLDLEKAEETEIKLPTSVGSSKKPKSSRRISIFALLTICQNLWLYGSQQIMENSERDRNTRSPDLPPEKSVFTSRRVKTGHGTTDWFQIGKVVHQGCICHPAYSTCMQSTSWVMPGWMKHKLESRFLGEISITSIMLMTPPLWQKVNKK